MEKVDKAVMVDDGESNHSAVKAFRYEILEHMSRWSSNWVAMQAENMNIRESCSEIRRELEELRSRCESTTDLELNEFDDEIRRSELGLQELFDERARLRRESAKVEVEVKRIEEVKYLKRNVEKEHKTIDTSETKFLKQVADIRRKTKPIEEDGSLKLSFVLATVKGKRLAALIDTGATHSFVSRKAARSFGKKTKMEGECSAFKAVNSSIRAIDGVLEDTQVKVGSWF